MKEYIERNDLIRKLEDDLANDINMYNSHIDKEIRDDKICFACDVLASAPAADVREVVYAKWIEDEFESLIPYEEDEDGNPVMHKYMRYKCSICGRNRKRKEPYCNCGAKMDLE